VGEVGSLKVYDITGRLVKTITRGSLLPDVSWYLDDERGRRLSNGVYFLELVTADKSDVRKVIVVD
ncbi:T9SS type A sorting domain-containing protein, partial [candidate division WOR-3 bacterium]|nr:T9SS type A sorting domain-containing protein [candidate division WOR-3 bacterium]